MGPRCNPHRQTQVHFLVSRSLTSVAVAGLFAGQLQASAASLAAEVAQLPTSFARCAHFFVLRQSPAVPRNPRVRELCYGSFAVLHSGDTKTPVFVAQRLNKQALGGIKRQNDRFFADARLPRAERAELDDYKRSGYSRGHMAPSGDMATEEALAQSFSLANMVPQSIRHNSGAWSKIEQDTRKYVQRANGDVFVITGPVFDSGSLRIGENGVRVPTHVFKLVFDSQTRKAWAHWQRNADDEVASKPISYSELVQRTGVQWLPAGALAH
ncbi:DNA/RNA non-specific endonuclease [Paucibacter oligotrophus]|uniref:DNA/RNA non-specific endonuclease n=1 Tax=Roseateles oligotrophus TaxID=1769250 RepID=A0ABT2YMT2_9BURK|nr:DNA/RNA non-specific endonuclease [Roseateles oligotrophus]MCV2371363.1 DNA/RNA non-specific endonuclease [Roseateles oligotrophus]